MVIILSELNYILHNYAANLEAGVLACENNCMLMKIKRLDCHCVPEPALLLMIVHVSCPVKDPTAPLR